MMNSIFRLSAAFLCLLSSGYMAAKPVPMAPQRVAASAPALGFVAYSSDSSVPGVYSIPTDGASNTPELVSEMIDDIASLYEIYGCGYADGRFYVTGVEEFWGMKFMEVYAYDAETWEFLGFNYVVDDASLLSTDFVYDPTNGKVYGCFFNAEADGYNFATIDFEAENPVSQPIRALDEGWTACAITPEGVLYAISDSGKLYVVDKTNGEMTLVGDTGLSPYYMGSAAIDPRTHRFYWNLNPEDGASYLYEVDPATAAPTLICRLANDEEIFGMYVPAPEAEDDAPAAVHSLTAVFEGAALSGEVCFSMPVHTFAGESLSGDISYTLMRSGVVVAEGTAAPGQEVKVQLTVPDAGNYDFVAFASNETGPGPKSTLSMWVGPDVPFAPASVTAAYSSGMMTVTWEPVTSGTNAGYVGDITYNVARYSDTDSIGITVASGIVGCSFSDPLPLPESLVAYRYAVTAVGAGGESVPAESNAVCIGVATPPFFTDFSSAADALCFTVIDANADGREWAYAVDYGCMRVMYNGNAPMDDWLITPAFRLEAGMKYEFYFSARAFSDIYTERLEVAWGDSPTAQAMEEVLISSAELNSGYFKRFSVVVAPSESGVYYFGIHGISDTDQFYLYVDDLGVSAGVCDSAPAAPQIRIEADPTGVRSAVVTVSAPSTDIGGAPLDSLDSLTVTLDDAVIGTFSPIAPGEVVSLDATVEEDGDYTFRAVASNAFGAGEVASVDAYIGIPAPAAPASASVVETDILGEVTISWTPVTTSAAGYPIDPQCVSYVIIGPDEVVAQGITECSYTYRAVPQGQQDFMYYGIYAVTNGGFSEHYTMTNMVIVGTPAQMPVTESFDNGELAVPLGADGEADWDLFPGDYFPDITDADNTNGFAGMYAQAPGMSAQLFTGKIAVSGTNPCLSFFYYSFAEDDTNELTVYAAELGGTPQLLTSLVQNGGAPGQWHLVRVPLTDFIGKDVQIIFDGLIRSYKYIFIDAIEISDYVPRHDDLSVSIYAPAEVHPDEQLDIVVSVTNCADNVVDASAYTVTLSRNGSVVAECPGESIEPYRTRRFYFSGMFNVTDPEEIVFVAEAVFDADVNKADNVAQVPVILVLPDYPAPDSLRAEATTQGVTLSWSAPDLSLIPKVAVTEDFEGFAPFSTEGTGGWTFCDADGEEIGGIGNADFDLPSSLAYFVVNTTSPSVGGNASYMAHSGVQYLATVYNRSGSRQSDWLLSPPLCGDAQTVTFYARSYNNSFLESFKVYYTTTSCDIPSFVEIASFDRIPGTWTLYSVDLPADALYFAIECVSADQFMFFIDDVTYIPADAESVTLSVVGYNVYRNGVRINTSPVTACDFFDPDGGLGDTYEVSVVYDKCESAPSAKVTITEIAATASISAAEVAVKVVGRTITVVSDEAPVMIYSADGKLLYRGEAGVNSLTVVPGAYIVKAGSGISKVAVR